MHNSRPDFDFCFCLYQDFQETQSDLEVILEFLEEYYKQNPLNALPPVTADKLSWTLEEDSCRQCWTCGEPPVSTETRPLKTLASDICENVHLLPLSVPIFQQRRTSAFAGARQAGGCQPKQTSIGVRVWATAKNGNETSNQIPCHSGREWWVLLFMVTTHGYYQHCSSPEGNMTNWAQKTSLLPSETADLPAV